MSTNSHNTVSKKLCTTWKGRQIQIWIETITPIKANKLLESNYARNRTFKDWHVTDIATMILADHYDLNGCPIVFDDTGTLLDGQHRLKAVVQSGKAIDTLCVSGVRTDVYMSIDQYISTKSFADILRGHGYARSASLAAATTWLQKFMVGSLDKTSKKSLLVDRRLLLSIVQQHPMLIESVAEMSSLYERSVPKIIGCGLLSFVYYTTRLISPEYAKQYCEILVGLGGMTDIDLTSAFWIRKRLITAAQATRQLERLQFRQKVGILINGWNVFCLGIECKTSSHLIPRPGRAFPQFKNSEGEVICYSDITWPRPK